MTQHPDARVFIVDDDAGVRDALGWLLRTRRLLSEGYGSAEAFLEELSRWHQPPGTPCCLLLDVRMEGMSGLALFEHLLTLPWLPVMPVIFLSGHADVPTAVDAVKRGAFDFCEKPFSDNALVDRIEQALDQSAQALAQRRVQNEIRQRLDSLTERERDVLIEVGHGRTNAEVAERLYISPLTAKTHVSRILTKLHARDRAQLVVIAYETGLVRPGN